MASFARQLGRILIAVLGLASLSEAGVLRSRINEGVKIDYKEVSDLHPPSARDEQA